MKKPEEEEEEEEDEFDLKVILVGETGTGKTSLIKTSIGLEFQDKLESTQSSSIFQKKMKIDDQTYTINLWDTIGQEQYRSLTKIFMKGAKIVIFVYDITRLYTFEQLEFWYENAKEVLGERPVYGVCGNKSDLYMKEEVKDDIAEEYANKIGASFKLTSAKTPKNFNDFLEILVNNYLKKIEGRKPSIVDGMKLSGNKGGGKSNKKKKMCC